MSDVLAFGEILWDVIDGVPYIGGAAFNFAAHLRLCGLSSALVSRIGTDELGVRARQEVESLHVDASFITDDPVHATGTVVATLLNGIPTYDIKTDVAWDFIQVPDGTPLPESPRAFYFGTLAQRGEVSRTTLFRLLDAYSDSEVFFDVNLRQSFWNEEVIRTSLPYATFVKLNDEESNRLSAILSGRQLDIRGFAAFLLQEYPRLKAVITTLGAEGCLVSEAGGRQFQSPATPDKPVDTVGAGDAFSAAFIASWLNGASAEEAARAGNIRGGLVASLPGAIPFR
ncbi:MAG: carbohydrate kinase [Kiritimatiellae bacterium]|nr:carbohydrate kinase [Kiritimatiellia bacterium]